MVFKRCQAGNWCLKQNAFKAKSYLCFQANQRINTGNQLWVITVSKTVIGKNGNR